MVFVNNIWYKIEKNVQYKHKKIQDQTFSFKRHEINFD